MARLLLNGRTWEQARDDARKAGIILTRRPHSKGGYVCRASNELKEALQLQMELRNLPEFISGKL